MGDFHSALPLPRESFTVFPGYVVGQRFSSVTGYIQNHHFFGIVHIEVGQKMTCLSKNGNKDFTNPDLTGKILFSRTMSTS